MEGTAMLMYQTHSFSKKACSRQGSGLGQKMYYTV